MSSAASTPKFPEFLESPECPDGAPAPPGDAAERAERALAAHGHARLPDTGELHSAMCDYVDALRARGAAPQEMLVAVKRLMERAWPAGWRADADQRRALGEQVVRWCIEEYYRAADAEPAA